MWESKVYKMNKYSMKISERENIEWVNNWRAEANVEIRRCLLIGDSTTRQLRSSIEFLLKDVYAVDLFAASFSIFDEQLFDNLKTFLKRNEYVYDVMVLHYGGQHGFSRRCIESKQTRKSYYKQYKKLTNYLHRKCEKIVIVTGTSQTLDEDMEVIDEIIEKEIIVRNEIIKDIARRYQYKVFDLYTLTKENRNDCKYFDRNHFTRDTDWFISYSLLTFMDDETIIDKKLLRIAIQKTRERMESFLIGGAKKYVIYGTGFFGKRLFWLLKWSGLEQNIKCFVVTKQENRQQLFGTPIIEIDDLPESVRMTDVLIISSEKYQCEMMQKAKEMKFRYVVDGTKKVFPL